MNQDKVWHHLQTETPEVFHKSEGRLRFLLQQVKRKTRAGAKVLNVGVGNGLFEEMAIEIGLDVYSLDPSEESIARLNTRLNMKGQAKTGYLQAVPFETELFEAVIVSEVLEHLSDEALGKALREIHRVLSPEGFLMGTVPAREDLGELLIICPHCGERFHRWGHLQSFDIERMRSLLSQYFHVTEVAEKFLDAWSRLNWKGKALSSLKRALLRLGIKGSDNALYFSAIKR